MGMIAIGGAIGTTLFLGSRYSIALAGPAVIVSYAIGGMLAFLMMGSLSEMCITHPTSGSFGSYAEYYINPASGFLVRYFYILAMILGVGTEVTAIPEYMGFWYPTIPGWVWVSGAGILVIGVNAVHVRGFGTAEYWFSTTKLLAIIGFIVVCLFVLLARRTPEDVVHNLTGVNGGFAPFGLSGIWKGVIVASMGFFSLEIIAVAAGEAKNPKQAARTAFNVTLLRLGLFYIVSVGVTMALVPWVSIIGSNSTSPFVIAMREASIPFAPAVLNVVVIVAALSSMNSMLYVTSRMVFSLSRGGYAPAAFGNVSAHGVPLMAIAVSVTGIIFAVGLYLFNPRRAFPIMLGVSAFGEWFCWGYIFITHFFFRAYCAQHGTILEFKVPLYPLWPIVGLLILAGIAIAIPFSPFAFILYFGVPAVLVLLAAYYIWSRLARGNRRGKGR